MTIPGHLTIYRYYLAGLITERPPRHQPCRPFSCAHFVRRDSAMKSSLRFLALMEQPDLCGDHTRSGFPVPEERTSGAAAHPEFGGTGVAARPAPVSH